MIEREKIVEAKTLMDAIVELQDSYDRLNEPNAHINICTVVEQKPISTPLCETIAPTFRRLLKSE